MVEGRMNMRESFKSYLEHQKTPTRRGASCVYSKIKFERLKLEVIFKYQITKSASTLAKF